MRKNVFGVKNLSSIIYGIICFFPMFAILGRVIYTQSNPNAKDSFSKIESLDYQLLDNQTEIVVDKNYNFVATSDLLQLQTMGYINVSNVQFIIGKPSNYPNNVTKFQVYYNGNQGSYSIQWVGDQTIYSSLGNTSQGLTQGYNFSFTSSSTITNNYGNNVKLISYGTQVQLDNAFEYSVNEFTKDNNFGEIDCFSWFTDVFLDSSNAKNMLYINFLNWYLNYTLFASCGYIMFLVIYWFINFVRRILDKSMYQEYGGF